MQTGGEDSKPWPRLSQHGPLWKECSFWCPVVGGIVSTGLLTVDVPLHWVLSCCHCPD